MAKETFDQAKARIFGELRGLGWKVRDRDDFGRPLKVPHATNAAGDMRLWFKPQAVWLSLGVKHEIGNARSIFVDVRGTDAASLVAHADKWRD